MCAQQGKDTTILGSRAHRYLNKMRGKWLPPVKDIDRPELLSVDFVHFLATLGGEYLTDEERYFYSRLNRASKIRKIANLKIDILIPYVL